MCLYALRNFDVFCYYKNVTNHILVLKSWRANSCHVKVAKFIQQSGVDGKPKQ